MSCVLPPQLCVSIAMDPPVSCPVLSAPPALASATHAFLFGRLQLYMQHHDYESAVFIAERIITDIREHIRGVTEEAQKKKQKQQHTADDGEESAGVPAWQATLLRLSHSLESVQHLLALSQYHAHNARRRGGLAGGSGSAVPSGASKSAAPAGSSFVPSGGGGASIAYELLKDCHRFTEDNQFMFAHCWSETTRRDRGRASGRQPGGTPADTGDTDALALCPSATSSSAIPKPSKLSCNSVAPSSTRRPLIPSSIPIRLCRRSSRPKERKACCCSERFACQHTTHTQRRNRLHTFVVLIACDVVVVYV